MKIETSRTTEFEGYRIEDVVFLGVCLPHDRAAFEEVRIALEDLMRARDPAAVLLDLLDVDEIVIDDLRELVGIAVGTGRPRDPRICALAVRNITVIRSDRTLVHDLHIPAVLSRGSVKTWVMDDLKARLTSRDGRPHGRRPVYFPEKPSLLPAWWVERLDEGSNAECLWRMGEPSIFKLSRDPAYHGYRFLWRRSFDPPIAVRIEIEPARTGFLTAKKLSGHAGFQPGRLIDRRAAALTGETVRAVLEGLERADFWHSRIADDRMGIDGAYWIIEGAKNGAYRVDERWSPKEGPFRETALLMLSLSGLDVGRVY